MNLLIVLSQLFTGVGLSLLFLFFLLGEKTRRELAIMYLNNPKSGQFYTKRVSKVWALLNVSIISLFLCVGISKFAVKYHEVANPPAKEEVVITTEVPQAKSSVKMNAEVFYTCLSTAKGKEGIKAAEIQACREAATIELYVNSEDNVKYTLSKREVVFY